MPVAEVGALRIEEKVEGALHVLVIVQGLAHPHVDEIRERPLRVHGGIADGAQIGVDAIDLVGDFTGGEVALEAHGRGQAEPASHGATDLGRDAERAADAARRTR